MSCDASYVLIERDRVRYFYNRLGGHSLPGALLEGPDKFTSYVAGNHAASAFQLETFFHGVAIVNLETRDLFWWSDGLKSAAWWRMFQALLAAMWPGWRIETAMAPERALDARLPGAADRVLSAETDRTTADAALAENMARLSKAQQDPQQWAWVQEVGLAEALRVIEHEHERTWLCVLDEDGALRDDYLAGDPPLLELTAGPAVLDLLAAHRPRRTLEQLGLAESALQAGAYVDRARRRLWWWATSAWLRGPASDLAMSWPGWHVTPLPGGPRAQLALSDRSHAPLLRRHCLDELRADFERVIEHHDSKDVRQHFERLLQTADWQPSPP